MQCALLCHESGVQHDILTCLEGKGRDSTGTEDELIHELNDEGTGAGKKWTLVYGFPESKQGYHESEEKAASTYVNKSLLTSSSRNKLCSVLKCLVHGLLHLVQ